MKKETLVLLGLLSTLSFANDTILDSNQSEVIRQKLIVTLERVKRFKLEKNNQIKKLNEELQNSKQAFLSYRMEKEAEIKRLRQALRAGQEALARESIECEQFQIEQLETVEPITQTEESPLRPLPIEEKPWVEVVVKKGMNLYDLALEYYGDKEAYAQIYASNQAKIPNTQELQEGVVLRMPVTNNFKKDLLNQDQGTTTEQVD